MPYIGNIVQDFSVNTAMLNTDSVTSIKIDDGTIVNADINDSAAIAGSKISPDFGSQNIVTTGDLTVSGGDITLNGTTCLLNFNDTNNNPDFRIQVEAGNFLIEDATNSYADRFVISSGGNIGINNNNPQTSLDVTGAITGTAGLNIEGATVFNESGSDADFRIESDTLTHMFFVDAGNNRIGIGTASPTSNALLSVNGRCHVDTTLTFGTNTTLDSAVQATIYKPDTNMLAFATAGNNERMRIDNSGKVGIGTTSPAQIFHVKNTGSHTTWRIENDNADFLIQAGDAGADGLHFYDMDNTAYRMTIANSGNVGINTTSPSSKLHVDGGNVTNSVEIDGTGGHELYSYHDSGGVGWATGTGGTYGELLYLDENGSTVRLYSGGTERFRVSGTEAVFNETGASVDFRVEGDTSTHLLFVDASTDRVGIGVSSPSTVLHIADSDAELTLERTGTHSTSDSPLIQFKGRGPNATMYNFAKIDAVSTGSNNAGHLRFYTNASGTQAEKMRVLSGGQVNIGDDLTQTSRTVSIHGGGDVGQLQVKGTEADIWMYSTGPNAVWRLLGSTGANTHRFRIYDSTNSKEPFFIEGSSGTNTSHVHINSGNLIFDQAGTGIDFSATANNSGSTSELLDEYEEGSFTPVLLNDGNSTYDKQVGKYTKIGNMVWFNVEVHIGSVDSGAGGTTGIGLPFNNNTDLQITSTLVGNEGWDADLKLNNLAGWMSNNDNNVFFYKNSGNNLNGISVTDIGNNGEIVITLFMRTNAG